MAGDFDDQVAHRRLEQALLRLGLTFAESSALVRIAPPGPDQPDIGWRIDEDSGAEHLVLSPAAASLDLGILEMALRQQILHRSMYSGFGEQYADAELANLTLEVCINRLLVEAYGERMRKASRVLYAGFAKTAAALANVSANPLDVPDPLRELWQGVWRRIGNDYAPLNPASLYFRLHRLKASGQMSGCTGCCSRPGQGVATRQVARAAGAVAKDVGKHLPRGSDLGQSMAAYAVVPLQIGQDDVEAFLARLAVRRLQQQTASKILEPLLRTTRVDPYPTFPTRLGLVYQLCGVSDAFGLFWNRDVANTGARLAVGIYVDVSGSMIRLFPVVAGFVEALREVPLRIRSFDTQVRQIPAEDLQRGVLVGGGGTDFDAPVADLVDDPEIEAGVLFTDGEAELSASLGRRLIRSRKRLYVVYLVRTDPPKGSLDQYVTDAIVVRT